MKQEEAQVDTQDARPVPAGFFTLSVQWKAGTTPEEIEAASPKIRELTVQLATEPEDIIPLCIQSLTYKRDIK